MITALSVDNEPEQENPLTPESSVTTEKFDEPPSLKLVASIFTKEGRRLAPIQFLRTSKAEVEPFAVQKLREQNAFATKPRNSRKKHAESPVSPVPPDSTTDSPKELPIAKTRRPRKRLECTTAIALRTTKRKKKTLKDEDSDYKDTEHANRKSHILKLKVKTMVGFGTGGTGVTSNCPSELPSLSDDELNLNSTADLDHPQRKRRKNVHPRNLMRDSVIKPAGSGLKDTEMSDISPTSGRPLTSFLAADTPTASTSRETQDTSQIEKGSNSLSIEGVSESESTAKVSQVEPAKVIHPFFVPGGMKKSTNKPIHPFTVQSGMKMTSLLPESNLSTNCDSMPTTPMTSRTAAPPAGELRLTAEKIHRRFNGDLLLSPTSSRILKMPGMADAPWPGREQTHVRGLSYGENHPSHPPLPLITKKLKETSIDISDEEDLLARLAVHLHVEAYKDRISQHTYYQEKHFRLSSTLHLPEKMIMSGPDLQEEVRKRTASRLPHPDNSLLRAKRETSVSSDCSTVEPTKENVHPAIRRLYADLHDGSTPFDSGSSETLLWTAKFAPETSEEVLQVGKEMSILRDWLLRLMVEIGGDSSKKRKKRKAKGKDGATSTNGTRPKARKKNRRGKGDGLDDFIVESDEDGDEMDEITDLEDNGGLGSRNVYGFPIKKSTIRTGDKIASEAEDLGFNAITGSTALGGVHGGKMVNAVVISGPPGCGKTAAVYAVAYETGYTVFEVNPGGRRNGKDLLDQVGEMSKNHLVHNSKKNPMASTASFSKPRCQLEEVIERANQIDDKAQSQSLILLEEVDLLYEEDKQFWQTVVTLMGKSKRPIVMTCNDESVIPLDTLSLHAILRLAPPPEDLTADYLLLLAANEGHLLTRDAVRGLYRAVRSDLRAAIMELSFWCQMGVGNRRAGLDWILQRFPKGIDLNEKGELMRVVSNNTYINGLSWVPQREDDGVIDSSNTKPHEDEIWRAMWDDYEIDVGADGVEIARGMNPWASELQEKDDIHVKLMVLGAYDIYVDSLSAVDVYAGRGIRGEENPLLDMTQPKFSAYARNDDLKGYQFVEAPILSSPNSIDTLMSITIRSLARSYLASETNSCLSDPGEYGILPYSTEALVNTICNRQEISVATRPIHSSFISAAFTPMSLSSNTATTLKDTNISGTMHSIVHNPTKIITVDIAPYIRAIIRHDQHKEQERTKASLLSLNGGKALRSTRAARLALQGSDRGSGKRGAEKYFSRGNPGHILATGGDRWGKYVETQLESMISDAQEHSAKANCSGSET